MKKKNKNNLKKILIMILLVFSLTGCTTILKDSKGKAVQNKTTGQSLTKNILCQPESKETIALYKKNKIDLDKMPKCSEMPIVAGEYEGIWTTIFVKPLAWIIIQIGEFFKNYGVAIIITTLLIRIVTMPVTKKAALQSENLKKAQPELERLEKKYTNKTDQNSMMQKNQEMLAIYQKYQINPMSSCLFSLLQIPLFFAFYEAMNRLPAIFESSFLGFQLGTNPMTALSHGKILYLIFIVLVILTSYYSFKLNSGASMSKEQEKQMKMMSNFMTIFIGIASLTLSTGIAIYWIVNSGFTILQNIWVKRRKAA
ncbi:MAG: YidC/Oxa1 family membrane protein insertase [Firmicutes bacterium]|nr:YidC/Oxa1 family membrane protein insertase [Bacillota bacterium]